MLLIFWRMQFWLVSVVSKTSESHLLSLSCDVLLHYFHEKSTFTSFGQCLLLDSIRYGLDGPRIESRWRRDFPHPSRPALGPTQPFVKWVPGFFFPGVKGPRHGVDYTNSFDTEVKERVEVYLYSPHGPSRPVLGWTVPFTALFLDRSPYYGLGKLCSSFQRDNAFCCKLTSSRHREFRKFTNYHLSCKECYSLNRFWKICPL